MGRFLNVVRLMVSRAVTPDLLQMVYLSFNITLVIIMVGYSYKKQYKALNKTDTNVDESHSVYYG
jgi:hypothetical protein